jgi:hypothetical protein
MSATLTDRPGPLLLLALVSCAAHAPEGKPTPAPAPPAAVQAVTHGRGFTVPIPPGFKELQKSLGGNMDAVLEAGGVVLAENKRQEMEDAFLASLVVAPTPQLDFDPGDEAICTEVARVSSEMVGAEVLAVHVVTLKTGKTCQWESKSANSVVRGVKGTIIPGSPPWMIICNYDLRDRPAQAGCDQFVTGFEFSAP